MVISSQTITQGAKSTVRTLDAKAVAKTGARISSVDIMRGLVIILMMMDHVRERIFLHVPEGDPMKVDEISPALFFTRYAAHLCAPVFIFLTGISAWLYVHPAKGGLRSPTGLLFKRGIFLIFIEVTVIYFVWVGTIILAIVLYYPTKAFANYKHREKRNKPWLSYL